MDTTTPLPPRKTAKKSKALTLQDTSTFRILMHLAYRHRVGLLVANNIMLISYFVYTNLFV